LASRNIAAVRRLVLGGETFVDLFDEMDTIRKDLHVESGREAINRCASRLEDVLLKYQSRLRDTERDREADFRKTLDILNDVLHHFTTDNQQSEERRKQLENNLSVATRIEDLTSLRAQLGKILQSVRDEGRRETIKAQEVINGLGKQIQKVHKAQAHFTSPLPGRGKAIDYLTPLLHAIPPVSNLYLAIFAADSLRAIRGRHGEEVANTILKDLALKQLQQAFPESQVFCWSASTLLLVWQSQEESAAAGEILSRLKPCYEQRAFVGTRMAVFNVVLRSLLLQSKGTIDEVAVTLDRFSREGGAS